MYKNNSKIKIIKSYHKKIIRKQLIKDPNQFNFSNNLSIKIKFISIFKIKMILKAYK